MGIARQNEAFKISGGNGSVIRGGQVEDRHSGIKLVMPSPHRGEGKTMPEMPKEMPRGQVTILYV